MDKSPYTRNMSSIVQENEFRFPELVFGLAGAIGTDLTTIGDHLTDALTRVQYTVNTIHLIEGVREFENWHNIPETPTDARYKSHMDAGDAFRKATGCMEAVALLGLGKIPQERMSKTHDANKPASRAAYLLRSFKRPEEVRALREIYGKNFVLIAAFSTQENRKKVLGRQIARSKKVDLSEVSPIVDELIERDERDTENTFGQDLREAFPLADFFVNADERKLLRDQINRIIELIFGNTFITPTPDEYGMFHAWASSLRSASLARQVGASLCSDGCEVISLGCNEVPKAGGGQYWPTDSSDKRDHTIGYDPNDHIKLSILADILNRLGKSGWLSEAKTTKGGMELIKESLTDKSADGIGKCLLLNITEFGREVHAEMAALMAAARRGTAVGGSTLYCTTFPCHNCAKHIVAAGIRRVVYIEPYPKSRALELHDDAIRLGPERSSTQYVCFEPFVGVSPRQYFDLFSIGAINRKENAVVVEWHPKNAVPRLKTSPLAYMRREGDALVEFEKAITAAGLQISRNNVNLVTK
jgi:deoxycytidylate deaminase